MTLAGRIALLALLGLTASPARAQGWPQPAAGFSSTGDPELIFTFDDGPNPQTTPLVLDILKARGIQAVFFEVGEMVVQPRALPIIERTLAEGHIVANHTMTHGDLCRETDEKAAAEIDDGYRALHAAAQMPIPWFRAPYGAKCLRLEAQLAERQVTHFHWDIDPQEWKHGNVKLTVARVTRAIAANQGRVVILLHDVKRATVAALPIILQWIDDENLKREAAGRRKIRIVQASHYALETLRPGVWALLRDLVPGPEWGARIATLLP